MDDTGLMILAAIFVFIMVIVMVLAVVIPFSLGVYMMFTCGTMKRKVFMIILYAVLIFLFIQFKMYNVRLM